MNISLGTPPFPIVAIADTGSDLIWTQCKPCTNCYKQNAAVFSPNSSSTYKTVPCQSSACDSRNGVATTPLIPDPSQPTFYVVQLEAVSVGSKKIPFHGSTVGETSSGNIIVDSGTTLTLVPTDFFTQLSSAVESQVTGSNKTTDPQGYLSLCYVSGPKLKVPSITAHFKGADVALTVENVFIKVSDTVACLAFYGNDDVSIYGNVAQQNFRVGYDLQKHTLSFKPTDCTQKFF
ncbi:unnamed protein product [Linum tenue]|uniref:Peptidase A1 domain-containing protein n=1 Tax=Linum tenue TaxID=586396 RepID=A0AAV0KKL8_9ROSI|nr:unnamed protein product [Linum tenue]